MKKIILIIALLVLLLIGAGGAWAYFAFLYTKPLTKAELAELTPDWDKATGGNWSPWFVEADGTTVWNPAASYNAWLATVPEEEKAWPVMVDLYYKYEQTLLRSDDLGVLPAEMQDWESLRAKLDEPEVAGDIQRLIDAFKLPHLGANLYGYDDFSKMTAYSNATFDPVVLGAMQRWGVENARLIHDPAENPMLLGNDSTGLSEHRSLVRLAEAAALSRFDSGDIDSCIEILDTVSRSAGLGDEFPSLMNQLIAIAIESSVNRHIAYIVMEDRGRLNDQQLMALDAILRRHHSRVYNWQGAAISEHDTARRMTDPQGNYLASGFGDMKFPMGAPCSLPDTRLSDAAQRVLYTINMYEQSVDDTLPWDPDRKRAQASRVKHPKLAYSARMMLGMMLMPPEKIGGSWRVHHQETIATRLAIAVERHRLRHGVYPSAIETIDTDLLDFEPIDAFGGSLQYRLTDAGPLIYSKSDDRDDDRGAPMLEYDIEALFETAPKPKTKMMSRYYKSKKASIGVRDYPLWITFEQVKEIQAIEPKAVDGDWVLYPITISDPEPIDEEDSDD